MCACEHVGTRGAVVAAPARLRSHYYPWLLVCSCEACGWLNLWGRATSSSFCLRLSSRAEDQHSRLLTHTDDAESRLGPPPGSRCRVGRFWVVASQAQQEVGDQALTHAAKGGLAARLPTAPRGKRTQALFYLLKRAPDGVVHAALP